MEIIASATAVLTPEEARAAEALVLDRAGRLTPSGLRSAIARAVIEVAPEKAKKRREKAARDARVERWPEASGNEGLAGRELPPAQVLAAGQKISARARELKKAGLDGSMDELRARACLDILLGQDSRPRQDGPGGGGPGTPAPDGPPAGVIPAGFAGKVNLIIPLATLLELAERPGELPGIGPIDPDPGANTSDRYPNRGVGLDQDDPPRGVVTEPLSCRSCRLCAGVGPAGYQCRGGVIQDGEHDARRTSVAVAAMQPA